MPTAPQITSIAKNASGVYVVTYADGQTETIQHEISLLVGPNGAALQPNADGSATMVERFLAVAAATMIRPANTTAYSANDAVSNNATPGSVAALSFAISNANDTPITLERLRILTSDTGPGAAPATFRAWFFRSDPTANTGVGGGDNAAWSQKQAGSIGSMSGTFRAFSDGSGAVLVPDEGSRVICKPVSGGVTVYALLQTLTAFTPSANSTTFDTTLEGFQGAA